MNAFLIALFCIMGGISNYMVVNVLRHSEIMTNWRARWEASGHWKRKMTECSYCLSFNTGAVCCLPALVIFVLTASFHPLVSAIFGAPYIWLCVVFTSNFLHDCIKHLERFPRVDIETQLNELARVEREAAEDENDDDGKQS